MLDMQLSKAKHMIIPILRQTIVIFSTTYYLSIILYDIYKFKVCYYLKIVFFMHFCFDSVEHMLHDTYYIYLLCTYLALRENNNILI